MTSIIAFLIALTFGTANVRMADYQNIMEQEQVRMTKDDGIGVNGTGGQVNDNPERP
jgi:hypothetical protein